MRKKDKFFTLMFIPEDNGKTITFRIPKYMLFSAVFIFIVVVSGMLLLLFKSGEIAAKLQLFSLVRMENEKLSKENDELRYIAQKINQFEEFSQYLYNLAIPMNLQNIETRKPATNVSTKKELKKESDEKRQNPELKFDISDLKISSYPNIAPVEGWITRHFVFDSLDKRIGHQGLDFAAAQGTPIKATAPGVVGRVENDKYFGIVITLFHENNFVTKYGHCSQVLVNKHSRVNRGQTIALVGNTGRSTAPHVHYEIIKDGKNVDPLNFIITHKD